MTIMTTETSLRDHYLLVFVTLKIARGHMTGCFLELQVIDGGNILTKTFLTRHL